MELHIPVVSYRLICGVLKMLTVTNCISGTSTPTEGLLSQEVTETLEEGMNREGTQLSVCVKNRRMDCNNNNNKNNQNNMSSNLVIFLELGSMGESYILGKRVP